MAIQPTQPQGIGSVLDTSFQLYKSTLGRVWPISLLLAVVTAPPIIYTLVAGVRMPENPTLSMSLEMMFSANDPVRSLLNVACNFLMVAVLGALLLKQRAFATDEQLSIGEALKAAFRRFGTLVGASILYGLAVAGGVLLLLIPGLILSVSLILTMPVLLFEGKGAIESLKGSHKLVWGNWWRTSAIFTVAFVLVMLIFVAAGIVIGIATPFMGMAAGDLEFVTQVAELFFNALFYLLFSPFMSAVMIALYWDLKLRKEGGDLAARVGTLNAA